MELYAGKGDTVWVFTIYGVGIYIPRDKGGKGIIRHVIFDCVQIVVVGHGYRRRNVDETLASFFAVLCLG